MSRLLNIGCGMTCHDEWLNIDLVASAPAVRAHDVTRGLPFDSGSFDACYSSHVLEHLDAEQGLRLLQEQKRVLASGGTVRVVVPDLEVICRNYLAFLDRVMRDGGDFEFMYDYSRLELLDQLTRETSGGELGRVWRSSQLSPAELDFIRERHGSCALDQIEQLHRSAKVPLLKKLASRRGASMALRRARILLGELLVRAVLGGTGARALRVGLFRSSGEVHRTMYDRHSLRRLLVEAGFKDVRVVAADESRIPDFCRYQLDVQVGIVRKPDSLFMEAVAP